VFDMVRCLLLCGLRGRVSFALSPGAAWRFPKKCDPLTASACLQVRPNPNLRRRGGALPIELVETPRARRRLPDTASQGRKRIIADVGRDSSNGDWTGAHASHSGVPFHPNNPFDAPFEVGRTAREGNTRAEAWACY